MSGVFGWLLWAAILGYGHRRQDRFRRWACDGHGRMIELTALIQMPVFPIASAGRSCTFTSQGADAMKWIDLVAYFFGGAFLANAIPHFVSGMMGRAFQSPFAKPRGEGLSSSAVNALWGFANLIAAYLLLCHVGDFNLRDSWDALPFGIGMLLLSVLTAHHFGQFNGGNAPERS